MLLSYKVIFFRMELNFFELQNWKKNSSTRKINYCFFFSFRGKICEVKPSFEGHLQGKPMQEISKAVDNGLCKVRRRLETGIVS